MEVEGENESYSDFVKRKVDESLKAEQLGSLDADSKVKLNDDVKHVIGKAYDAKPKMTPAAVYRRIYDKTWETNDDVQACLKQIEIDAEECAKAGLRGFKTMYLIKKTRSRYEIGAPQDLAEIPEMPRSAASRHSMNT